jgi:antitoxin VapB
MPAGLGVEPDLEWLVAKDENGQLIIRSKPKAKRKFNIDKVWGCAAGSGLQLIKDEDRVFEERPLLWDDPEWRAKYMPDA